jgi:hypothetical protein
MIFLFVFSIYLPFDSWQNEYIEEMQVRGHYITRFPSIHPYEHTGLDSLRIIENENRLWLPNISSCIEHDSITVFRLKPALYYSWLDFSTCVQPVFKFGDDGLPPNRVFRVFDRDLFSADYERAYIKYSQKYFSVFVGRERFAIGPSARYNLLVSGYSAPMDWAGYFVRSDILSFTFLFSRLDNMNTKPLAYINDTITQFIDARRYLTVKRFDFSPYTWLNFGLSEAAIFGGENYGLELYHFNPVVFIQAFQYNLNHDVNFFLSFDTKIYFNNIALYGVLLLDDFQIENDSNREPHHWGMGAGIEMADIAGIKKTFWILEYNAVSRFTYCHFVPYQRYQYRETAIGSPYGPDHDEIFTKFTFHATDAIDVFGQFTFLRKGEGEIASLWPIPEYPRQEGVFFPADNFLSGIVEQSIHTGLGARYFFQDCLALELYAGLSIYQNFNHVAELDETSMMFRCQIDFLDL